MRKNSTGISHLTRINAAFLHSKRGNWGEYRILVVRSTPVLDAGVCFGVALPVCANRRYLAHKLHGSRRGIMPKLTLCSLVLSGIFLLLAKPLKGEERGAMIESYFNCYHELLKSYPSAPSSNSALILDWRGDEGYDREDSGFVRVSLNGSTRFDVSKWSREILQDPNVAANLRAEAKSWQEGHSLFAKINLKDRDEWVRIDGHNFNVGKTWMVIHGEKVMTQAPTLDLSRIATPLSEDEAKGKLLSTLREMLEWLPMAYRGKIQKGEFDLEQPPRANLMSALESCRTIGDKELAALSARQSRYLAQLNPNNLTGIDGYGFCLNELSPLTDGPECPVKRDP